MRVVNDKKRHVIYNLPETEIEETNEWWKDKSFETELDRRSKALESGNDKGVSLEHLEAYIDKLRKEIYGR